MTRVRATLGTSVASTLLRRMIRHAPLNLCSPSTSLSPLWVLSPPLVVFFPHVVVRQSPWWLVIPWNQWILDVAIYFPLANGLGAPPNSSKSLWEFWFESLLFYPPYLGVDHFKHLIVVCPCTRIVWFFIYFFAMIKPIWLPYHSLSWNNLRFANMNIYGCWCSFYSPSS